jgi:nanoRNase/pAp phosphatase (c-di-AMP/oligoRNAs hydrolase)
MALKPNQQAVELIGRAKNILLVTREQADTDAIASVLALALAAGCRGAWRFAGYASDAHQAQREGRSPFGTVV